MSSKRPTVPFGGDLINASTPTSNFAEGNNNSSYVYQQGTPTSTKHMISFQNTSDDYHTANEESFNVTANYSMNNSIIQQNINTQSNVLTGAQTGMSTTTSATGLTTMAARKQMLPLDQSEPAKPLSAYALFFRDTVSAIKQQNPTCSFQELSKIVASMWDALDPVHKAVYNKKNELARVEYLKQLRIYQQQQLQRQEELNTNDNEAPQADTNTQQQTSVQQVTQPLVNTINVQESTEQVYNNNVVTATKPVPTTSTTTSANSGEPSDDQMLISTEDGPVQKCLRANCNRKGIINPDWEDEYCSNECVIIHCRNVFNDWVQSNLAAEKQEQQQQQTAAT